MKNIQNGWTFENTLGAIMSFEHIPIKKARKLVETRDSIFIIETINFTFAEGDEKTVHHNKYFSFGLGNALSVAANLEISNKDVAEEVICIRTASDEEVSDFLIVDKYYITKMPKAIPIEKVRFLLKDQHKRKN